MPNALQPITYMSDRFLDINPQLHFIKETEDWCFSSAI